MSFEIPLTQNAAARFQNWFNNNAGDLNVYTLRRGEAMETFNCVVAAVTVLVNYLTSLGGGYEGYVEQLLTVNDSTQFPAVSSV